ncbi:MAG TPA: hypothetical protein VFB74_34080 [Kribbellaceae bacterium]|nr:hypothetical protein [Kribbellaceae bacterium]
MAGPSLRIDAVSYDPNEGPAGWFTAAPRGGSTNHPALGVTQDATAGSGEALRVLSRNAGVPVLTLRGAGVLLDLRNSAGSTVFAVGQDGGQTGIGRELFDDLTGDHAGVAASTVLVHSGLALTLDASSTWLVEAMAVYTGVTTGDIKFGWTVPAGATGTWVPGGITSAATGSTGAVSLGAKAFSDTAIVGAVDAVTPLVAMIRGIVRMGVTAGAVELDYAQGTSDPTATIMKADSWLRAKRVA